jgi:transketolase C-terminal domain/subunit
MRTPSAVVYGADYKFDFGKGHVLRESDADAAVIVSSGRGVHEALGAAEECGKSGLRVAVVDMPSIDEELVVRLCESGKLIVLAEQNNGYIFQNVLKVLYRRRSRAASALDNLMTINTLDAEGKPRFIHSGTYEELVEAFGLSSSRLAKAIVARVRRAQ